MKQTAKMLADATLYPVWLDNPAAPETCPHLIGRTEADLLIVGGGFTGLWSAIIAKERDPGRDVVVIEAGKVAHGGSGRPGGIVSASVMHGLVNAKRNFPNDLGVLEQLGAENIADWRATIERHGIDADLEWNGEMTTAVTKGDLPKLREEYQLHADHGHKVDWLERDQVREQIASPMFEAAFWNRGNTGIVHPAKLAWGLKKAALSLGVRLFEHTPMERIEDKGSHIAVKTHDGIITAPKVLFATNAWGAGHRKIKRRIVAMRDRVIATEPLSPEQLDRVGWQNRQGIYDTRTQLNYMRLTADNRIVYGGRIGYYYGNQTDPKGDRQIEVYNRLAGYFLNTFPMLDDVKFTHAWSGPIDLTTRMTVHFQPYYGDKGLYVGGYSGFGVTASRFGARMALDLIDAANRPEMKLDFARTLPGYLPPEPFRYIGAALTMRALDEVDEKGGWRKAWIKLVHALGFPL